MEVLPLSILAENSQKRKKQNHSKVRFADAINDATSSNGTTSRDSQLKKLLYQDDTAREPPNRDFVSAMRHESNSKEKTEIKKGSPLPILEAAGLEIIHNGHLLNNEQLFHHIRVPAKI